MGVYTPAEMQLSSDFFIYILIYRNVCFKDSILCRWSLAAVSNWSRCVATESAEKAERMKTGRRTERGGKREGEGQRKMKRGIEGWGARE